MDFFFKTLMYVSNYSTGQENICRLRTRIGAQCYKYTGRSDAYFFIHVQGPLEDFHFQTQLANTLDKRIC